MFQVRLNLPKFIQCHCKNVKRNKRTGHFRIELISYTEQKIHLYLYWFDAPSGVARILGLGCKKFIKFVGFLKGEV
jgi:hypothetical protein